MPPQVSATDVATMLTASSSLAHHGKPTQYPHRTCRVRKLFGLNSCARRTGMRSTKRSGFSRIHATVASTSHFDETTGGTPSRGHGRRPERRYFPNNGSVSIPLP